MTQVFQQDSTPNAGTPPVENNRVYVLDDEHQVLEVIEMQLTAAGFDVVTYSRSADFLRQANQLPRGVIVSD